MDVLTEDYIKPFGVNVPKDNLINLASGVELPGNITNKIINLRNFGNEKYDKFLKERLMERKIKTSLYPIPRRNIKVFNYIIFNVKISHIKIVKPTEVNYDILAKISAISSEWQGN